MKWMHAVKNVVKYLLCMQSNKVELVENRYLDGCGFVRSVISINILGKWDWNKRSDPYNCSFGYSINWNTDSYSSFLDAFRIIVELHIPMKPVATYSPSRTVHSLFERAINRQKKAKSEIEGEKWGRARARKNRSASNEQKIKLTNWAQHIWTVLAKQTI